MVVEIVVVDADTFDRNDGDVQIVESALDVFDTLIVVDFVIGVNVRLTDVVDVVEGVV